MSMSRRRLPTWTGDALHLKMPRPEHMAKSYAEHVELFDLVERGEAASAVDLLEHHIRYKGESFWPVPETTPKSRWAKIWALSE